METAHSKEDWNQRGTLYRNTNIHATRLPIVTKPVHSNGWCLNVRLNKRFSARLAFPSLIIIDDVLCPQI